MQFLQNLFTGWNPTGRLHPRRRIRVREAGVANAGAKVEAQNLMFAPKVLLSSVFFDFVGRGL